MTPEQIRKEIAMLNVLSASLLALHKGALELLESARRNAKKCVECGADLLEDDVELCQKHFDMEMSRVMQESKHPDEK